MTVTFQQYEKCTTLVLYVHVSITDSGWLLYIYGHDHTYLYSFYALKEKEKGIRVTGTLYILYIQILYLKFFTLYFMICTV